MSKCKKHTQSKQSATARHSLAAALSSYRPPVLHRKAANSKSRVNLCLSPHDEALSLDVEEDCGLEVCRDVSALDQQLRDTADGEVSLNRTLTEKLKALGFNYDIEQRFVAFQEMFSTVITLDTQFGLLLTRIKAGYEERLSLISRTEALAENAQLHSQLASIQSLLEQEQSESKSLRSRLDQLQTAVDRLTAQLAEKEAALKAKGLQADAERAKWQQAVSRLETEAEWARRRETQLVGALKSTQRRGFQSEGALSSAHRRKASSSTFLSPPQFDQVSPISPITPPDSPRFPDLSFSRACALLLRRD